MGLDVSRAEAAVCVVDATDAVLLVRQVRFQPANDVVGLARIVRTGWYCEVRSKSEVSHRMRSLLAARAKLVSMRKEVEWRFLPMGPGAGCWACTWKAGGSTRRRRRRLRRWPTEQPSR